MMVVNFQSIWGKKEQFEMLLIDSNTDVVIGTETHLDPSIGNSEFLPPGYSAFRRDRGDGWGGVIIIVKSSLIADQIYSSKDTECIAVKIESFQKPVVICAVYRPPRNDQQYLDLLACDLSTVMQKHKTSPHWIGGDLNLPDINWGTNEISGHQYSKKINESFTNMMNDCNLEQIINFPTRQDKYLDILLTNNTSLLTSVNDIPGISDHTTIAIVDAMCHPLRNRPIKRTIYLWNSADISHQKDILQNKVTDFCRVYNAENSSINEQWYKFKEIVNSVMENVPSKTTSARYNQPWINQDCKKLSRRKKRLYNRAKRTNLKPDWDKFKNMSSKCKKACRNAHNKYINENIINSDNPKRFYSYIKSRKQDNVSVGPLKKGEIFVIDDIQKANILNKQYCSVFSQPVEDRHTYS
jgi:hypothetical protein